METNSWKSHAAGTLAKRNQMLSEQRLGVGMPPRAMSTSILDPSAYSARGKSSHHHVFDENDSYEIAKIVSPSIAPSSSFSPRDELEPGIAPGSDSSVSRPRDRENTLSPTSLRMMPPQRVQLSRVNGRTLLQQEEYDANLPSQYHLPPRFDARNSQVSRQEDRSRRPSLTASSWKTNAAASTSQVPLPLPTRAHSASASEHQEFDVSSAESAVSSEPAQPNIPTAQDAVQSGNTLLRVPSINPYLHANAAKLKSSTADLVFEDSESDDDAAQAGALNIPELSAEEKLNLEVLRQQFDHLLEAVKSKKLTGAVKISHGMNALRLALRLHASHVHVDSVLDDLQTVLYKLAWDYYSLFFEAETFQTLVDVFIDGRSKVCSKLALQSFLVFFERDVRVNGGIVRTDLFDHLHDIIAACLVNEDDAFQLEWGLWFASYFASRPELANDVFAIFPLEQMLQILMEEGVHASLKHKIMQALRNLSAGCVELHAQLTDHPSFASWLLRQCSKQRVNPTTEDRMLHVQSLGVVWNLCISPNSAAKLLMLGVYDALAMVLEMPFSDTQEMALLALADIAKTESGRLRLLDSRLAVTLCGLAKSMPPPSAGVLEGIMRVLFSLSETEHIKINKARNSGKLPDPSPKKTDAKSVNSLKVDEHFFRSMGIIDVVGHLLRNGGEITKLLALGTLVNLCQIPKNIPVIQRLVAPDVEQIANSLTSPAPLRERAQALTVVMNDRSRNSCALM